MYKHLYECGNSQNTNGSCSLGYFVRTLWGIHDSSTSGHIFLRISENLVHKCALEVTFLVPKKL